MRTSILGILAIFALIAGVSTVVKANSTPDSARSELQLELGELLFSDERYWEAIVAYDLAKVGARPVQLLRASTGLLRSLLKVAEFNRAYREALFLGDLDSSDPDLEALQADAFWASGLFEEAEVKYRDVLAVEPSNAAAHHGFGRSLAARSRLEEGLAEVITAIASGDQRPEFYHTLGSIYRRLRRYQESSDALEQYVELLPTVRQSKRAEWARSEILFLRSFGDLVPFEITTDANAVHTIPFQVVNEKIVVRGRVNGSELIDLVVDTGSEQMVLSQETADEVGVRPITSTISAGVGEVGIRGLDLGRVDSLEIGSLHVRNLPSLIKNPPLTGLPSRRVPNSISPIAFGLSTLIDYENHKILLGRHLPDSPADIELPMRVHRLALVRGVVNEEHPRSFVVDTGGEVISLSIGTAGVLGMVPSRHIPLRVYGTSGWDTDAFLLPGIQLAFNQITYDNFSVVVLNLHRPSALLGFHIGGIVGHTFLKNYRVALDLERSMLRLTRL